MKMPNDLNRGEVLADGPHGMPGMDAGAGAGGAAEQAVPLEALAMPGQDEIMNKPEVGDPVSYQVEGKLSRIEGNTAYVTPETVNGKPVSDEAAKTADEGEDLEKKQLYDLAEAQDSGAAAQAPGQAPQPQAEGMA